MSTPAPGSATIISACCSAFAAARSDAALLVGAHVAEQHAHRSPGAQHARRGDRHLVLRDERAADVRAVAAAEIGDRERRSVPAHARVLARDAVVGRLRPEELAPEDQPQ
jgi:hypothetical protein